MNGIDQDRVGVSLGTQWRPSDQFELRFDALYSDIDIHEDQGQTVYGQNNWGNWDNGSWGAYNAPGASYTIVDGAVVAATLPFSSVTTVIADYDEEQGTFRRGPEWRWSGERGASPAICLIRRPSAKTSGRRCAPRSIRTDDLGYARRQATDDHHQRGSDDSCRSLRRTIGAAASMGPSIWTMS